MLNRLQQLGQGQRIVVFFMFFGGGLMAIIGITLLLIVLSINTAARVTASAVEEGVSVAEFAVLPGDDAYPAAVAVAPDGSVYTGSYASGVLWTLSEGGEPAEIAESRDRIGAVTALSVGPDGTLYILDRLDSNPRSSGGLLWAYHPERGLSEVGDIGDEEGFVAPVALAVDGAGAVYAADLGRREVWRFTPGMGDPSLWWEPPVSAVEEEGESEVFIPTALAYEPATDAILITGPVVNTIYRVPVSQEATQIVYSYDGDLPPGFDGITVGPDGTLYLAALDQNAVMALREDQLVMLAQGFRGASDVAAGPDGRLYVTNFDSRALVTPGVAPQLPFGIDVVTVE